MRALILTGPDHFSQRAVSGALRQAFAARGDTCLIVRALELLGAHPSLSQARALEQAFLNPRGFAFLSAGNTFVRTGKPKSPIYDVNARYAENLRLLLSQGEFDAVLCLERYCAEAVSHVRKTLALSARCCFVSCDYACVPFLEETRLDYYFTAHESSCEAYASRGFANQKIVPAGIPLPTNWFSQEDRADARALLNLPQNLPCYFIPYARDSVKAVSALLPKVRPENGRVCVVSPDSALPKSPFAARFAGDIRVVIIDPDDPLSRYFAACDVVLCAPIGALCASAAVSGLPLALLPAGDPLEAQTARFFEARGIGRMAQSEETAAALAVMLANDRTEREAMLQPQRANPMQNGAPQIVRFLHEGRLTSAV